MKKGNNTMKKRNNVTKKRRKAMKERDDLLKKVNNGEILALPQEYIRLLGIVGAALLAQMLLECDYAIDNNFFADEAFLTNADRLSNYLGITKQELQKNLDMLQNYGFIEWRESDIEDTLLISIYHDNIANCKSELDEKYKDIKWETGLKQAQNPVDKATKFKKSTLILKEYMEKHYTSDIPIIAYQMANILISEYESDGLCFA